MFGFVLPLWGQSSENTPPDILIDDLPVAERSVSPWGSSGLGDILQFDLRDSMYVSDPDPGDSTRFVCGVSRSSSDSSEDLVLGFTAADSCRPTFDTILNPSWGSSDVFVVSVSDGIDDSMADLTIFQNSPPRLVGGDIGSRGLVNLSEGFSVDVSTFFSDRDVSRTSDVLSFGLGKVMAPEGVDVDLVGSMLTASAPVEAAIYDIVVCATDTIMASVCDSLVLDWSFNLAPVVLVGEVSQSRLTLHPGGSITLDLGSSDFVRNTEENDPLSCELSRAMSDTAENVAFSLSGCSVTFTPGDVGLGSDMFTLTVTDSAGGSDSGDFVVVYSDPPPTAPEVRIGRVSPRRLIFPQGGSLVLDLSHSDFVVDPNNDDLSCTVSRAATEPNVNVLFETDECLVTFSAGPDGSGADQFSLEVDDNTGRTDSENFTVYQNTPPDILIDDLPAEDRSISPGESSDVDLRSRRFVSNPESFQDLECEVSRVESDTVANLQLRENARSSCSFTLRARAIPDAVWGSDSFEVSVSDGVDTTTVGLVLWMNSPPEIVGEDVFRLNRRISDGSYVADISRFSSFSDADAGDSSLSVEIGDVSPDTITPVLDGSSLTVPVSSSVGVYSIDVCAQDRATAKICYELIVNWLSSAGYVNSPPDVLIGEISQNELVFAQDGSLVLDLTDFRFVTDPDTADSLSCTLTRESTDSSQNVDISSNNCSVTFTSGSAGPGHDRFLLTVSDGNGGSDSAAFAVYQNTPPDIRIQDLPVEDFSVPTGGRLWFDFGSLPYVFDPDSFQTLTCALVRHSQEFSRENIQIRPGPGRVRNGRLYNTSAFPCRLNFDNLVDMQQPWYMQLGVDRFHLTVTDGIASTMQTISVWHNHPPHVNRGDIGAVARTVETGDYVVDMSTLFSDRDSSHSLTFELGAITPSSLTVVKSGSTITVSAPNRTIDHTIPICAFDDFGAKACDDLVINWSAPLAPEIVIGDLPAGRRVVSPGGAISFDLTDAEFVTDPDSDPSQDFVCSIIRTSTFTWIHVDHDLMGCQLSFSSGVDGWGSDQFTLTVSDGTFVDEVEVVIWQNRSPQILGDSDPIVRKIVDRALQIDLTRHFADPDTADVLQYSIDTKTPNTIRPTVSGAVLNAIAPTGPQEHTIRICAEDAATLQVCKTFTINWISNRPPVISIDPATQGERVVAPGGSLVLDLAGFVSDPDLDTPTCTVTREVTDTTQNVTFAANGCVITFESGTAGWGADVFELLVDDGSSGTAEATFTVWQNRAPVENSNADSLVRRKFSAGDLQVDLTGYFTDPDTATGDTLTYTLGTLNPATLTAAISGDMLAVTAPDDVAMHLVGVCATDDASQSFCRTITFDWVANRLPVVDLGEIAETVQVVAPGGNLTLDFTPTVSDPDSEDDLACSLVREAGDLTVNVAFTADGCVVTFEPGSDGWGSDLFEFSVDDGDGGTADASFRVWHNRVPVLIRGANPAISLKFTVMDHQVDLTGYFSDPDVGDTLDFALGTLDPSTIAPTVSGSVLNLSSPDSAARHMVEVCATDDATLEVCGTFTISWVDNNPPEILIDRPTQELLVFTPGGSLMLDLSGSDYVHEPDDDDADDGLTCTLTRAAADTTVNVAFTADGCSVTFGPGSAGWGSDLFSLQVDDSSGGSDTANFVVWQNSPPVVTGGAIDAVDRKFQTGDLEVDLTDHFTDPDTGDTLDFDLGTLNPTTLTPDITGNILTATAPDAAVTHTIQVCVEDDATQEVCGTFTINWINNQLPTLIQGAADQPLQIPLNIGDTHQILITDHYQDADSPDTDLAWTLTTISTTDTSVATVEVDPTNPGQLNIAALTTGTTHYHLAATDGLDTTSVQRLEISVTQPTTQPPTQPTTQPTTNTQPTTGGGGSSFIPSTPPGPSPGVGPAAGPATEPSGTTSTFTDTVGNTHQDNIDQLAEQGISRGCNPPNNDRYCPDRPVTRAEMATFMVRAFNLTASGAGQFTDTGGNTHQTNIGILAANQITSGCNPPTNDRYCPDRPVTRAQMGTFLARVLQLPVGSGGFTDTTDSVHRDDINRIAAAGITRGCNPPENSRYCPDRPVTRAEMATFLTRAQNLP